MGMETELVPQSAAPRLIRTRKLSPRYAQFRQVLALQRVTFRRVPTLTWTLLTRTLRRSRRLDCQRLIRTRKLSPRYAQFRQVLPLQRVTFRRVPTLTRTLLTRTLRQSHRCNCSVGCELKMLHGLAHL